VIGEVNEVVPHWHVVRMMSLPVDVVDEDLGLVVQLGSAWCSGVDGWMFGSCPGVAGAADAGCESSHSPSPAPPAGPVL
jgi:hypothetical protein